MKKEINDSMNVCVLISCMYQRHDIIDRTHVQTNVVVVNQCDEENVEEWDFVNAIGKTCHAKFISTKERGLSRSRNMAIRNANGDICIISDDDEELVGGYEAIVREAYKGDVKPDLVTFAFERKDKSFPVNTFFKHDVRTLLRTSSVEITFSLDTIKKDNIFFDEKMGSGTGNGPGEETMFLMTCWRKGLKMFYDSNVIGKLLSTDSQWFNGYTERYFENFGWSSRRVFGSFMSCAFIMLWLIKHYSLYCKEITTFKAARSSLKGWLSKR